MDEAITFINEGDKPLALYAFTDNEKTRHRFTEETSSGALNFGLPIAHLRIHGLPFGDVGESGIGSYHGTCSFATFSHRKALLDVPLRLGRTGAAKLSNTKVPWSLGRPAPPA